MHNVILIGDIHIATREDAVRVSAWMHEHINPKKDRLILMGDLIDSGLDRGMGWDQDSTTKQILYLKKMLEPYTILGYVLGNHERRITAKTGLNPYQAIYGNETVEYEFFGHKLAIAHGKSGAANQALELERMTGVYPDAEVVALGHTHSLGIYALAGSVIGLRTGSLQQYPDYARRAIMIPKPLGCIRIYPKDFRFELVM